MANIVTESSHTNQQSTDLTVVTCSFYWSTLTLTTIGEVPGPVGEIHAPNAICGQSNAILSIPGAQHRVPLRHDGSDVWCADIRNNCGQRRIDDLEHECSEDRFSNTDGWHQAVHGVAQSEQTGCAQALDPAHSIIAYCSWSSA